MKICFTCWHAYPVVNPVASGVFGGMETHAVILAETFAKQFEVSFLARNRLLVDCERINGVDWIPWRGFWNGLRWDVEECVEWTTISKVKRFKKFAPSLLWKIPLLLVSHPFRQRVRDPRQRISIFDRVDSNVFFAFGVNVVSTQTVFNAKRLGKPAVLFLEFDGELDERYHPGSTFVNEHGDQAEACYWTLKNADLIISQTEYQSRTLKERFGRDSVIVKNPFDFEGWIRNAQESRFVNPWEKEPYVLWIGRAENFHKRASLFVDLARQVPARKFLMIMNPSDSNVEREVRNQAPDNLKIVEKVPFAQMPSVFSQAACYINTSIQEGFPNVFLQAMASQTPTLSYEVGNEFLVESHAGICVNGDVKKAVELLNDYEDQNGTFADLEAAFKHLEENYSASLIVSQIKETMLQCDLQPDRKVTITHPFRHRDK